MKRIYLLVVFLLLAAIVMNAITLYLIAARFNNAAIHRIVANSMPPVITQEELSRRLDEVRMPTPVQGPHGEPGAAGPKGDAGKDGPSIIGPPGPKGDSGTPGREIELARDPDTGDLYMRYVGDTLWSLVESPNGN